MSGKPEDQLPAKMSARSSKKRKIVESPKEVSIKIRKQSKEEEEKQPSIRRSSRNDRKLDKSSVKPSENPEEQKEAGNKEEKQPDEISPETPGLDKPGNRASAKKVSKDPQHADCSEKSSKEVESANEREVGETGESEQQNPKSISLNEEKKDSKRSPKKRNTGQKGSEKTSPESALSGIGSGDKPTPEESSNKNKSFESPNSKESEKDQNEQTSKDQKTIEDENLEEELDSSDDEFEQAKRSMKVSKVMQLSEWRRRLLEELPGKIGENFTALERHLVEKKKAVDDFGAKLEDNTRVEEEKGEVNFDDELARLKENLSKTNSIDEQYEKWMEIRHEFIPSDN